MGAYRGPTPRRLKQYAVKCLRLKSYFRSPGDGRQQGRIPATALVWALLMGALLRRVAFAAIEALVGSRARRALEVSRSFGNDPLSYFTERLDPAVTPQAAVTAVHQAKRHKAFDDCRFIGLASGWHGRREIARKRLRSAPSHPPSEKGEPRLPSISWS